MAQKEGNWLQSFIINAVGPPKPKVEEPAPTGPLFKEINQLRQKDVDPNDKDAMEKQALAAKYSDGLLGQIAKSKVFEFATLGMISLNALAIGIGADYNARWVVPDNLYEGPIFFIVIENMFATYFTLEVIIKFLATREKLSCFCDSWFMFDCCLVTMMVGETWVLPFLGSGGPLAQLSILRLLRLLRITRMAKIMRVVPEMMVIVKGMAASVRTVSMTGVLLIAVLYTFSIIFTDAFHEHELAEDEEETESSAMFGTMGKSMFSLFIMGTVLDDVTAASNAIRETQNFWMLTAFIVFILISSFMMLNMLIGILVEVVAATAEGERGKTVEDNVREAIREIFDSMDEDEDKRISREEFENMQDNPKVKAALEDLDITDSHFHLFAELFFKEEDDISGPRSLCYDKLVGMILRLRPGTFVSALDFAAFAKVISEIHDRVKERVERVDALCMELARSECDLTEDEMKPTYTTGASLNFASLGSTPQHSQTQTLTLSQIEPGSPVSPCQVTAFDGGPLALESKEGLSDYDRERLEKQTSSAEIVEELLRRLGMADLDQTGVPFSMMDEELQSRMKAANEQSVEPYMTLGVPQSDNDSETVYV
jgi:voltage-gated sodium channel